MPQIIDATVVASAYTTSASARPVMLDNGWIITTVINTTTTPNRIHVYADKGDGSQPVLLGYTGVDNTTSHSIVGKGNNITILKATSGYIYSITFDATTVTQAYFDGANYKTVDSSQTSFNGVSLAINDTGTELHATWASKNYSYQYTFNIRYAKGTISGDGSVTWGAVEQVSKTNNTTYNHNNPSIVIYNNQPIIISTSSGSSSNMVGLFTKSFTTKNGFWNADTDTNWGNALIYAGGAYTQSSPSAIFVPQEIAIKNPMFASATQGVLAVAWHGKDSGNSFNRIRVSFSDDGGATWSTAEVVESVRGEYPTITANLANEIFIIYEKGGSVLKKAKYDGVWTYEDIKYSLSTPRPSTLFDSTFSIDFTEPLFIYKDGTKVGFYGTWTTTEISVPQGELDSVSDKNNLLSYTITTDGEMSEVVEKVNGVEVGRKTLASGQNTQVSLTQEQWDAVRFGKYADTTGGRNTLTIEMGSNTWTYPFEKTLSVDADLLSSVKAVKDANEVKLPVIKQLLVDKVGGSVADSFEGIIENGEYGVVGGKEYAEGNFSYTLEGSGTRVIRTIELPFTPMVLEVYVTEAYALGGFYDVVGNKAYAPSSNVSIYPFNVVGKKFDIQVVKSTTYTGNNVSVYWRAFSM